MAAKTSSACCHPGNSLIGLCAESAPPPGAKVASSGSNARTGRTAISWNNRTAKEAFPPAVRKVIYTTNAIESVNARLRKIIKTRGHFPTDEAATKLIFLALRNITSEWGRAAHDWKMAMNQFAILYDDRFTAHAR